MHNLVRRFHPRKAKKLWGPFAGFRRGRGFGSCEISPSAIPDPSVAEDNPLRNYFEAHRAGAGIWKWTHYFDIYHRHLQQFRGREVNILEIGIYSGGSLEMWREYLGPKATIFGVDIEPSCSAYENAYTHISLGDQGSRSFWRQFKSEHPPMDIIIDDGGHAAEQQIVTLEEMLPALNEGGVYICEDVHGDRHRFASFIYGLADRLNSGTLVASEDDAERRLSVRARGAQTMVEGISLYPFLVVVNRADGPVLEFVAPKHGTEWQPFLS